MYELVWSDLEKDPLRRGLVQRRVRPELPHDIHLRLEKPTGTRSVDMVLHGAVGDAWRRVPNSRGVDISITPQTETCARVRLIEKEPRFREIFTALVDDVVATLTETQPALETVVSRLRRWQACLETAADGLGEERQLGLYAELTVLVDHITPAVGITAAVDAWQGPSSALQDFQLDPAAIEVKASRAARPQRVHIASERQLDDTGCAQLVLLFLSVDARIGGTGRTLPDTVHRARQLAVAHPSAAARLEDLLLEAGYLDMHQPRYRTRFTVRQLHAYLVTPGFPRLTEADLPRGCGDLTYTIELDACEPWRIRHSQVAAILTTAVNA
jgi:hypothetical protein